MLHNLQKETVIFIENLINRGEKFAFYNKTISIKKELKLIN